jgi:cytochrome c-type biogenesis protein CcmH
MSTGAHFIDLAEMMILAAGGYVSPEAEEALVRGLELEPRNGTARYYAGLMYAQQGRPDLAFPIWRNLMAESTADAPWLDPIRLQIEEVAALAGERVTPGRPAAAQFGPAPGPTPSRWRPPPSFRRGSRRDDRGHGRGPRRRLATEGGPPEDWARLITAFGVLGRGRAGAGGL